MNYNFTNQTRLALNRARDEAERLKHDYVGTEHVLLALLSDDIVASVLKAVSVSLESVRAAVLAKVREGRMIMAEGEPLPYTSRAKKILTLAMEEARGQKVREVRTEHLLLAVLREEKGIGAEVLRESGLTVERVRSVMSRPYDRDRTSFRVRIDDTSDRSIYEQIVAQVTEGVATGELRGGERLATVRQLADELDIAPGTVARAYGELERQGVVITEGARGTRVAERMPRPPRKLDGPETLTGLLRPVAVAAFHLGATAAELRAALDAAMTGIFDKRDEAA